MKALYQQRLLGLDCELMLGWSSDVQANEVYLTRFWGFSIEAVFIGFVTAFMRKGVE
jgi:hypothetical protein